MERLKHIIVLPHGNRAIVRFVCNLLHRSYSEVAGVEDWNGRRWQANLGAIVVRISGKEWNLTAQARGRGSKKLGTLCQISYHRHCRCTARAAYETSLLKDSKSHWWLPSSIEMDVSRKPNQVDFSHIKVNPRSGIRCRWWVDQRSRKPVIAGERAFMRLSDSHQDQHDSDSLKEYRLWINWLNWEELKAMRTKPVQRQSSEVTRQPTTPR